MNIPTVESCLQLMDDYRMLDNIRAHSRVVARVAELITRGLAQKNGAAELNIDLVISASLLHDIAKTQCLENRCDHARVGGEICREHGFVEIAAIVEEHVLIKSNGSGLITEKEIVYYADKRVNHDQVVSLADRLAYILERYGRNNAVRHGLIQQNFAKCLTVEKLIFAGLDFHPEQLAARLMAKQDWRV
ncbi:MAG: HD domain-containing protein [Thermodesulfobacteriota bacterium]